MSAVGILLAAGAGTRMGGPKALLPWAGGTLVGHGVQVLLDGGCDDVLVVLGAAADRVALPAEATAVLATDWQTGMAASLRAGLSAAQRGDADDAVIALVDQPLVGAGAVRRLLAARTEGATVAVATYDGHRRNPVLLAREHWTSVAAGVDGDAGARQWMRRHPELVTETACDGTGSADDLDTPDDLERLLGLRSGA